MSDQTNTPEATQEHTIVSDPFSGWKDAPTPIAEEQDPAIEEKDEKIVEEERVNDKPGQPEAVPGASPEPIQDRPEEEKEAVAKPEPIKFANDESEKVYKLLLEGKQDEVVAILSEQKKLAEVDKLSPEEVLKMKLQYNHKEYTPQEVNDLFNEQYEKPEKPVQDMINEDDDDFAERMSKYEKQLAKVEARMARDTKTAVTELQKFQQEITLPDISKTSNEAVEPSQEELAAQQAVMDKFLQSVDDTIQKFNGYETAFKDEEVDIAVSYKPSKEEKESLKSLIALSSIDSGAFLKQLGWLDGEGNISAAKLAEDLPFIIDKQKILEKMVSETGNRRHEASVKKIKNIDYGKQPVSNGDMGKTNEQLQGEMANHFFSQT